MTTTDTDKRTLARLLYEAIISADHIRPVRTETTEAKIITLTPIDKT